MKQTRNNAAIFIFNQLRLFWIFCLIFLFVFKVSGAQQLVEYSQNDVQHNYNKLSGFNKIKSNHIPICNEIAWDEDELDEDDDENDVELISLVSYKLIQYYRSYHSLDISPICSYEQVFKSYTKIPLFIIFQNRKVDLCA